MTRVSSAWRRANYWRERAGEPAPRGAARAALLAWSLIMQMYHSKFLTDIPFILLLSGALALWRPSRRRSAPGDVAGDVVTVARAID